MLILSTLKRKTHANRYKLVFEQDNMDYLSRYYSLDSENRLDRKEMKVWAGHRVRVEVRNPDRFREYTGRRLGY